MVLVYAVADVDPNVLVPAALVAVPATIGAIASLVAARRSRGLHDEVRTNHGKRAGEYLEMIEPLLDWAEQHTKDDNEMRAEFGLHQIEGPDRP